MKLKLLLFCFITNLLAAQPNIDSLILKLKSTKEDTNKLNIYLNLAEFHPDEKEWQKYNDLAFDLADKLAESGNEQISQKAKMGLSSTLNNKGYVQIEKSNFLSALDFFEKALSLKKQNNIKAGLAENYTNLGAVMDKMGKLEKALQYYLLALNLKETQQDPKIKAAILGNIGNVYNTLGKPETALKYFEEDLKLNEQINNLQGIGKTISNISQIYAHLMNYPEAFKYAYRALNLAKKIKDESLERSAYSRLGDFYSDRKQYDSSIYYSEKCIALSKISGDYITIATEYSNLGYINIQNKNYKTAEIFLLRSFAIYDSLNSVYGLRPVSQLLTSLYDSIKDDKKALFFYKINSNIKDSLFKDENRSALIKQGMQMEFDKKEAVLKEQQDKERIISNEKDQQQKIIIWAVGGGLTLVILFSIFIFNRLQITRKQKLLIEAQKSETEKQKNIIEEQKRIVDEKQHEIISSINYAQRIQSAVLTGKDVWNKISKENFIVFQPRDIVSGDFYWAHVLSNGRAIFALADCTGHGVPGGFMSMLGNSFLNELVVENKLFKADEILNRLREKVIAALFQQGQTDQKDGMDIALCVWNKMDNTMEFAGANNALYLVRDKQLLEYKGDKMPIGSYLEENKKFTALKISLVAGDMIYLSTDGFADQFGGEREKKFKFKRLGELFIDISGEPVHEQKRTLQNTFINWKQNREQTDDVSVIGIKVV